VFGGASCWRGGRGVLVGGRPGGGGDHSRVLVFGNGRSPPRLLMRVHPIACGCMSRPTQCSMCAHARRPAGCGILSCVRDVLFCGGHMHVFFFSWVLGCGTGPSPPLHSFAGGADAGTSLGGFASGAAVTALFTRGGGFAISNSAPPTTNGTCGGAVAPHHWRVASHRNRPGGPCRRGWCGYVLVALCN
jgi:hypothetical protein